MRQTIRRRHKVKKDRLATFLAFFVMAPIISILIGLALVKYIILPRFLPVQNENATEIMQDDMINSDVLLQQDVQEANTNQQNTEKSSVQINQTKAEGITLYNIQVGNFSNIENAQTLANELIDKGLPGYIIKLDMYKVFVGTYSTRQEADKYLAKVKDVYSDAFINTFSIIERVISYNEDELDSAKKIIELIYEVDGVYKSEMSMWGNAMITKEVSTLLETMTENTSRLETMLEKLDLEINSEDLVKLSKNLKDHILQREKITKDLKDNVKSLNQSYAEYYSNYFEYVNFTK